MTILTIEQYHTLNALAKRLGKGHWLFFDLDVSKYHCQICNYYFEGRTILDSEHITDEHGINHLKEAGLLAFT